MPLSFDPRLSLPSPLVLFLFPTVKHKDEICAFHRSGAMDLISPEKTDCVCRQNRDPKSLKSGDASCNSKQALECRHPSPNKEKRKIALLRVYFPKRGSDDWSIGVNNKSLACPVAGVCPQIIDSGMEARLSIGMQVQLLALIDPRLANKEKKIRFYDEDNLLFRSRDHGQRHGVQPSQSRIRTYRLESKR